MPAHSAAVRPPNARAMVAISLCRSYSGASSARRRSVSGLALAAWACALARMSSRCLAQRRGLLGDGVAFAAGLGEVLAEQSLYWTWVLLDAASAPLTDLGRTEAAGCRRW